MPVPTGSSHNFPRESSNGDTNDEESIPLRYLPGPAKLVENSSTVNRRSNSSEGTSVGKVGHSNDDLEASEEVQQRQEVRIPMDVHRQRRSLALLAVYFLLLAIPFPLTVVMIYRPLNLSSYINFRDDYLIADFDFNYRAQVIVRILNSIRAVATVPLVGLVLAQVAVIYIQRRGAIKSQKISVTEIFRFADRGWTDPMALWHAIQRRQRFLPLAALVLLLFAITQPLEQLLVQTTSLNVMTCEDNPTCATVASARQVGSDPSLNAVAQVPLYRTLKIVSNAVASTMSVELNPYLWTKVYGKYDGEVAADNMDYAKPATLEESTWFFTNDDDEPFQSQPFWVSAIQNGTTTGILRQHALRLNSSIKCEPISVDDFPTPCPGNLPYVTGWSDDNDLMEISVVACVPGNYTQSPWNRSPNRQDIREELYISVHSFSKRMGYGNYADSFTRRCVAITTRGYFELGNNFNGQEPQPLLTTWPSVEEMNKSFVDYYEADTFGSMTSELLTTHENDTRQLDFFLPENVPDEYWIYYDDDGWLRRSHPAPAPGPLLQSVMASFGNQSLVGVLANNPMPRAAEIVCNYLQTPFVNFDTFFHFQPRCEPEDVDSPRLAMADALVQWIDNWWEITSMQEYLSFSMFFANYATLSTANSADITYSDTGSDGDTKIAPYRSIFTSEGYRTQKPTAAFASIIVLGVLYLMQFVVLVRLAVYIWQNPTWTHGLDSYAVGRMVLYMDDECHAELTRPTNTHGRSRRLSELHIPVGTYR